jgi:hypothetical protein
MNRRIFPPLAVVLILGLTLAGTAVHAQQPDATPTPAPTPSDEAPPPPAVPPGQPAAPPAVQTAPLSGQTEPVAPVTIAPPAPVSPTATPTPAPPARVADPPVVAILLAPAENPFGTAAQAPAALPPKLNFTDVTVSATEFVSTRVDAAGKPMGFRLERDPIPSLSAEVQRSLARWTFEPARGATGPVETWGAMRLDLLVEIDAPRSVQSSLVLVTSSTPIPSPLAWPTDEVWLQSRKGGTAEGGVPLDSVDTPPMPRKTPWDADSYKGPFSAKFWVRVKSSGLLEKAIPLAASDPVLVGYLRRAMSSWTFRPAQANGMAVDSWNELSLSGQISYSVELKQIASLRKSLVGS